MEKARLLKILPLILIVLVGTTLGGITLATWFNFNLVPWHLPSLTLENPFSLIIQPDMINAQGSVTGSGITSQEHQYECSITNIRTYGDGEPYLVDGSYVYGLWDSTDTLVETITSGTFENIPYGSSLTDTGFWIPTVSADDYTIKLVITDLDWHHSPSEMTFLSTAVDELGAFSITSITFDNDPSTYLCGDPVTFSFVIKDTVDPSEISTFAFHISIEHEDGTGRYTAVAVQTIVLDVADYLHFNDEWTSPDYTFNAPSTSGNWRIVLKDN